jgi:hypothetical protein
MPMLGIGILAAGKLTGRRLGLSENMFSWLWNFSIGTGKGYSGI